jgi:putative NIF3 family GTP cyclohydrolase 1 type 2
VTLVTGISLFAQDSGSGSGKSLTAQQVLDRIKKNTGIPWQTETVDTIKAGDPDTPVTGIATTFAATFDVLQRASASGKNLIIAHEPTFYNHQDSTKGLESDAVLAAKQAFIKEHHMVVWRFHDHWHRMQPDGILLGMTQKLGWTKYQDPGNKLLFALPETTLANFASEIKKRMGIRVMRVVGDPAMKLSQVALLPGASGMMDQIRMLERESVNVLVIGEGREWEIVEYARDAMTQGKRKALVILGHVPSEEAGMDYCATWLKTFVTEVPVSYVPAGEPFWTPK